MLPILQFIFQDFWHWLGALILSAVWLSVIMESLGGLCRVFRREG